MGFRGDVSQSRYSDRNRHTAVVRKTGEGRLCGEVGAGGVCETSVTFCPVSLQT